MSRIDEWNKMGDIEVMPQRGMSMPQMQTPAPMPQQPQKKSGGGIGGFIKGIAKAAVEPFDYLANATIVNPIREEAAKATHNKVALHNALDRSNQNLGLGDK